MPLSLADPPPPGGGIRPAASPPHSPNRKPPLATRRQHHRPRLDLCADRLRLCADLPGQPRAQSRPWRTDDARRLSGAGDRLAVQRPAGDGARRRHPAQPARRRAGLCLPHAQDDRRDGAGGHPHHRRARHPGARRHRADLVVAAAVPGAGARRRQSVARRPGRRAASRCGRRCWWRPTSRSMARCSPSCASAAGACACARPARTRCSPPSAASTCTASMRWPGACRR